MSPIPDDEPLTLPAAWTPAARPPLPIVAAIVPVVGAVVLWAVTGSAFALWFAALGPLVAAASALDAARGARRDRRRAHAEGVRARERVDRAVTERHDAERGEAWARHLDIARFVGRDEEIWRDHPDRRGALVVGTGEVRSRVRVSGGDDDADAAALRARAARLTAAPVVVPAADGVVVTGSGEGSSAVVSAVHRALVLQLCLAHPPGALRIVGPLRDDHAWAERLPHRAATTGVRLALAPGTDADIVIARGDAAEPPPPACRIRLAVRSLRSARLDRGTEVAQVDVEAVSREQAIALADDLARRAGRVPGMVAIDEGPVSLASLLESSPPAEPGHLAAALGRSLGEPFAVDLVADGPHAVVAGVTGSGKSELLITWIVSLCTTYSPQQVNLLLADFKGGTAFDALAGLPHVAGVITDLDGRGARRAIESLRAELRWRERALAEVGARDVRDPRASLPRLVVVVDEFAALLGDHPELHALFVDVAARGRALGLHLVLGTQRVAGVVRDNLLANCPLRISLRVTDSADSRAVVGTDEAALLPGGAAGAGTALVRRAADSEPVRLKVALAAPDDIAAAARHDGAPRRPWLPELPRRITLAELTALDVVARGDRGAPGDLLLGLADEPEHQRQRPVGLTVRDRGVLVVGGPSSGRTTALGLIAAQAPGALVRLPADPEVAWDALTRLTDRAPEPGTVIVVDDLDALPARFPPDHAHEFAERLERVIRAAGETGVFVAASSQRLTGAAGRIAELLPRRVTLPFRTRTDHFAAGGDSATFDPDAPPGRARLDGVAVQLAVAPERPEAPAAVPRAWWPVAALTGFVTRRSPVARSALAAWQRAGATVRSLDEHVADPVADGAVVLVGEPDDWQRHWRLLSQARGDHDLVVDTSCAAEFRLLTGSRSLPPYCEPGRGRAWLVSAGAEPVRISLPADDSSPGPGS